MKQTPSYPFYKSIRFRFGLLFNFLLLVFLLAVILLLYNNVKKELKKNELLRLSNGITTITQKTEINPLTVPLPQNNEHFLVSYNNTRSSDTLFNNLPVGVTGRQKSSMSKVDGWWVAKKTKTLETGGIITIVYAISSKEFDASEAQLQLILLLYIPVAMIMAVAAGYFLSGIFLKPLRDIISRTNQTDLVNDIKLLDEPLVKDELHELVDAVNRMLKRIEKQSKEQNAFFASASHELRTPLSNMLTELQTTPADDGKGPMQTLIDNQTAEVQRLRKLVNNFLLMSQLSAESITVNKAPFNLAELCIEKTGNIQSRGTENNHGFKIAIDPPDADFTVNADKDLLTVALDNLLSNALKYAVAGSVITVGISRTENEIVISIKNHIPAVIENVDFLKEQFKRGDVYKEGFGIGLWITDKLVSLHNGHLTLTAGADNFQASITFNPDRGIKS